MEIREEMSQDALGVYEVNERAFGRPDEAILVERLRAERAVSLSLVALEADRVVGHVLFSPVSIQHDEGGEQTAVALGPAAVLPEWQRRGIGMVLIREGLARCGELEKTAVVVLGDPAYYRRFGFQPASRFGIRNTFGAPEEAFMALELAPGALAGVSGVAHYHPIFAEVS